MPKISSNKFEKKHPVGSLRVAKSATVICVRWNPKVAEERMRRSQPRFSERVKEKFGSAITDSPFLQNFLSEENCGKDFDFFSGWEVLLGRNEVVNWLKSKKDKLEMMRYPGEYKLAGGNVDRNEGIRHAARRELIEEFLDVADVSVPYDEILLRRFSVRQTLPVRGKSNLMFNYIALAYGDENKWLQQLDIENINTRLRQKRVSFLKRMNSSSNHFFELSIEKRAAHSPEVVDLQWMPLDRAVENCLGSIVPGVFVDEWQKDDLKKYSLSRDPMVMTGITLIDLEKYPNPQALRWYSNSVDFRVLSRKAKFLSDGMSPDEVKKAIANRLKRGANRFTPLKEIAILRQKGLLVANL